ncbi:MAG: glycoside hydrolase family 6 protein, partial [Pseudomonadota bacterium]
MSSFKASAIKPRTASAITRSAIALGFSLAVSAFSSNVFAGCSYTVVNQWGNGFQAGIKITNTTSTPINGWDVSWRYSGDNRVGSSWNINFSGQNPYTARNVSWNGSIQPGQSVEFGFVGTKGSASAEIPAVTGAACAGGGTSSIAASSVQPSSVASSMQSSVAPSSTPPSSISSSIRSSASSASSGLSCPLGNSWPDCPESTWSDAYCLQHLGRVCNRGSSSSLISSQRSSIVGSSLASSRASMSRASTASAGARLDNPFVSDTPTKWYVNQDWANNARAHGGASIAGYNTAVWMDRIGAIAPTDPNAMGLRDHLDAALDQGANLFLVVVYDLPNRDCFALASAGELRIKEDGFNRYKNEYITPLAAILADPKYRGIRIVAIIEPDSLPNLVTNISDPDCQEAAGAGGYVEATQFTLNTLYPIPNVYSYIDIAHSGWLGWPENLDKATALIGNAIKGTTHGVNSIAGFVSNTANSTPLREPFLDEFSASGVPGNTGSQVRQAKYYEWNPHFSEFSFVNAWRAKMISSGFPSTIGMLVDTSRNGWGGAGRPAALSTSTNVDTFVDDSRIDRRTHRGMWCNQPSGIGERPVAAPAPGIDAYVWVKPPGESDGVATAGVIDPTDPAKGFDRFCDPTFTVPGNGKLTGAMAGAPHAGRWFAEGFKVLLEKAYPALNSVGSSVAASSRASSITSSVRSSTPIIGSSVASSTLSSVRSSVRSSTASSVMSSAVSSSTA